MQTRRSRVPLFSDVRSWADDIPLGSLDQLHQVANPSQLSHGDVDDPASIPLPISRESSSQYSGTKSLRRESESEHSVLTTQEQLRQSATAEAHHVPLPESSGLGSHRSSSDEASNVDSLVQLQTSGVALVVGQSTSSSAGKDHSTDQRSKDSALDTQEQLHHLERTEALNVPLTESHSLDGDKSVSAVDPSARLQPVDIPLAVDRPILRLAGQDYWKNIRPLTQILPHLKAILNGRHQRVGRIKSIDYFNNDMAPRSSRALEIGPQLDRDRLVWELQNMKRVHDGTIASRLIVVEDLCHDLIGALGLVFELDPEIFAEHLNRSGYHHADYEDPPPTRWNTAHLQKDHTSMTWMRPAYQSAKVAELLQIPGDILDPQNESPEISQTTAKIVWRDPEFNAEGERDGQAMEHTPIVDTNIFRQSWLLSGQSISRADFQDAQGEMQLGAGSQTRPYSTSEHKEADLRPAAWEEKVSLCYYGEGTRTPIVILLVDPLPAITDMQTPLPRSIAGDSTLQNPRSWRWGVRQTSTPDRSIRSPLEIALPMAPRLPIKMPRNKYKANKHELTSLERSFVTLVSTFDCIQPDDLSAQHVTAGASRAMPMMSLLKLIQSDTHVLFRSLSWTLDDISLESQDDFLMTRRLSEWRKLMNHFEIEIPAMAKRLKHFSNFVFRPSAEQWYPDEVSEILRAVRQDIKIARAKLSDAYTGLRADMQFTESRRSIAETKTVTRLTELAFIFVPLSFCASLFSMSIDELENGVPVWIFVVTALATIALAYAVRLLVGSELLINSTRRSLERFWRRTGVRRGADAPMLTIAWFVMQDVWNNGGSAIAASIAKFSCLAATLALPVAFMWTSENMGNSFNTAITLLVVLSIASALIMVSVGISVSTSFETRDEDDSSSFISV